MTAARPHRARIAALLTALLLAPLAVGCSADEAGTPPDARSKSGTSGASAPSTTPPPTPTAAPAPANIEKIAALTGCEATIRIEADELREGVCVTTRGKWIVTTFPEEKFKDIWLDTASMYGGTYLVGPKWAIGGKVEILNELHPEVGGELRKLRDMYAPAT
ncbi:hypothetical protein [Streptomyces paludis]|uniref:Lipoprotein n=1 Tax=Streptomyces paludis TaxID=2282738 RepID=A0A345HLU5_9ACTN|nr:hypothetical protein [Streptomyces paludis]AXG77669.1 hypothetical protein DVK44_08115 [Streptomyces paludis]